MEDYKTNGNNPAHPTLGNIGYNSDWQVEHGLTKRELFAAMAMQGLCTNIALSNHRNYDIKTMMKQAVLQADALLEELSKRDGNDKA